MLYDTIFIIISWKILTRKIIKIVVIAALVNSFGKRFQPVIDDKLAFNFFSCARRLLRIIFQDEIISPACICCLILLICSALNRKLQPVYKLLIEVELIVRRFYIFIFYGSRTILILSSEKLVQTQGHYLELVFKADRYCTAYHLALNRLTGINLSIVRFEKAVFIKTVCAKIRQIDHKQIIISVNGVLMRNSELTCISRCKSMIILGCIICSHYTCKISIRRIIACISCTHDLEYKRSSVVVVNDLFYKKLCFIIANIEFRSFGMIIIDTVMIETALSISSVKIINDNRKLFFVIIDINSKYIADTELTAVVWCKAVRFRCDINSGKISGNILNNYSSIVVFLVNLFAVYHIIYTAPDREAKVIISGCCGSKLKILTMNRRYLLLHYFVFGLESIHLLLINNISVCNAVLTINCKAVDLYLLGFLIDIYGNSNTIRIVGIRGHV